VEYVCSCRVFLFLRVMH